MASPVTVDIVSVWDVYRIREAKDAYVAITVETLLVAGAPTAEAAVHAARVLGEDAVVRERQVVVR